MNDDSAAEAASWGAFQVVVELERSVDVSREHIEIVEGARGPKARIRGSRIRVVDIVIWHERLRMTADEIVAHYPTLTLADVYAALAYYWDHKDELDQKIADDMAFVDEQKRKHLNLLEEKLARLRLG